MIVSYSAMLHSRPTSAMILIGGRADLLKVALARSQPPGQSRPDIEIKTSAKFGPSRRFLVLYWRAADEQKNCPSSSCTIVTLAVGYLGPDQVKVFSAPFAFRLSSADATSRTDMMTTLGLALDPLVQRCVIHRRKRHTMCQRRRVFDDH